MIILVPAGMVLEIRMVEFFGSAFNCFLNNIFKCLDSSATSRTKMGHPTDHAYARKHSLVATLRGRVARGCFGSGLEFRADVVVCRAVER